MSLDEGPEMEHRGENLQKQVTGCDVKGICKYISYHGITTTNEYL